MKIIKFLIENYLLFNSIVQHVDAFDNLVQVKRTMRKQQWH